MRSGVTSYQINELAGSQSKQLTALQARAGAKVAGAIQKASLKTGVDFSYLLQQAHVESSFNTTAKAKGSSASGLFQFIESTWLSMVKKYGDKYGLGDLADQISDSGKVASKAVRNQILALRKDAELSSLMAGEYASENKEYLESRVDGDVGSTELYMAHFMGPAGAGKFLEAMERNPDSKGADIFSREACSNPAIFYNKSGQKRSLEEIYALFDKKFSIDGQGSAPTIVTDTKAADSYTQAMLNKPAGTFDAFNENTGKWYATKNKIFDLSIADASATKTQKSYGGIPGYQSLVSNPVDIMALLEYGQPDTDRKEKSMWG